jgi:TolA-binding protein
MKKLFVLSMLISFAMLSSCQKQSSTGEQQLAQRKAELDAREKALEEREKAKASAQAALPDPQLQGLIRDPAQINAERDRRIQERVSQRERRMEELRARRMAHAVPPPGAEATLPSPSPTPQ